MSTEKIRIRMKAYDHKVLDNAVTKIVETIDYNEVALEGGLLNCTTWTLNSFQ